MKRCPIVAGPCEGRIDDLLIDFFRNKQDMAIAKQKLDAAGMIAPEFIILTLVDGGLIIFCKNVLLIRPFRLLAYAATAAGTLANNRRLR